jgi:hypothetical protein
VTPLLTKRQLPSKEGGGLREAKVFISCREGVREEPRRVNETAGQANPLITSPPPSSTATPILETAPSNPQDHGCPILNKVNGPKLLRYILFGRSIPAGGVISRF